LTHNGPSLSGHSFDSRGLVFTFAFFTPKHFGKGQLYLMTVKGQGRAGFDCSKKPNRARNAPVTQYSSATAPRLLPDAVLLYGVCGSIANGKLHFPL